MYIRGLPYILWSTKKVYHLSHFSFKYLPTHYDIRKIDCSTH